MGKMAMAISLILNPRNTSFYSKQVDLFSQEDSRGNCGMTKSRPLFVHTVAAR